jgi:hypothetical protein
MFKPMVQKLLNVKHFFIQNLIKSKFKKFGALFALLENAQ